LLSSLITLYALLFSFFVELELPSDDNYRIRYHRL